MKSAACLASFLVLACTLISFDDARAQQSSPLTSAPGSDARLGFCHDAANAMLKQYAVKKPDNSVVLQCLCSVSDSYIKGFMTWCVNYAKSDDLGHLQEGITNSPCIKEENIKHCSGQK